MKLSRSTLAGTVLGVVLGAVLTAALLPYLSPAPAAETLTKERKPDYWVAPMDANYRRDKPGKSPMGMDLIPVYSDENAATGGLAAWAQRRRFLRVCHRQAALSPFGRACR